MARTQERIKTDYKAMEESRGAIQQCRVCHIRYRAHEVQTLCSDCQEQAAELQIGMRVRILRLRPTGNGSEITTGTIYDYASPIPFPWCVRPDGWSESQTGIAYRTEVLEPLHTL